MTHKGWGRLSVFFAAMAIFFLAMAVMVERPDDPICTTHIVSAISGDTLAIEDYSGPPIEFLASVEESWTEGCEK